MKAISKLIRSGDKIPKEKIFQFRFEDDKVEDVKSMSLKKAVKFFQNKYSTHKIAKVYYINKRGHRLFSIIKLKVGRKKKIDKWS